MDIIEKVHAQTTSPTPSTTVTAIPSASPTPTPVDTIASPTILFEPPGGTVTPTPTQATGPGIFLATSQTNYTVGQKLKVQISVDTKGQLITQYKAQITYDPNYLQIVDADPNTTGTQIDFLDTFFSADVNQANQTSGTITLIGSSQSSTSVSGRVVADFEMFVLKDGFTNIQIVQADSQLLSNSVNILQAVNQLSLTMTKAGQPTPSVLPSKTPHTALADDIGGTDALIIGTVLVIIGIYLFRNRRHEKI